MATVGFAVAASFIPGVGPILGPVLIAAAAGAGAYVDQTLVYPNLFPPPSNRGPNLSDFDYQGVEEGTSMNYHIGEHTRTQGVLIWVSPPEKL